MRTRPGPAGPGTDTPGAQCRGSISARLFVSAGLDPARAREAELGLRAVACGADPLAPVGEPLLELDPPALVLSALKPAENGDGMVIRVLNESLWGIATRLKRHSCVGLPRYPLVAQT